MRPGPAPSVRAVVVAWLAFAVLMAPLGGGYRLSVAVGATILAIAAVGVDVCVGSAGLLVFSSPAFMLVGALSTALVARHSGLGPTAVTLGGLAVGLVAGALLAGLVAAALRRVQGIGVALVTLFVLQLVRAVARQQESLGGTLGLGGIPPFEVGPFRASTPPAHAVVVMTALAAVMVFAALFVRSGRGLEVRAAAGDATAAAAAGIPVSRRRAEAFVVGSLCATLAGSLYAHVLGYVSADAFSVAVLMNLLLMVFLGGAGSVWGVLPGAVAVVVLPDLWLGPTRFDMVVRGAALLAVLTLASDGIAGVVGRMVRRTGTVPSRWRLGPGRSEAPRWATARRNGGVVLEASGLTHTFGGVRALDEVNLTLVAGEVCAVIGANGAGKTTLFNVLSGHLAPDAGCIAVAGLDLGRVAPHVRARLGVARTFQEVRLFPGLTVGQHVDVAARHTPHDTLELTGLEAVADVIADQLPFGAQRRVELARALAAEPAVLLLDEPASGLSARERDDLATLLRLLAGGPAIVVVEHDVAFALSVATRVIVLDAGHVCFDGPPGAVDAAGALDAYLGRR